MTEEEALPSDVSDLMELADRTEKAGKEGAATKIRELAGRVLKIIEEGPPPANLPATIPALGPPAPMMRTGSGLALVAQNLDQAVDFAKLMSEAPGMVPNHLLGKPGSCLGIIMQAAQWGLSPYSVAQKSYIARDGQPIAYESQLIHAVILRNAPIEGRLKHEFLGEKEERRCRVWARIKGEETDAEFTSEPISVLRPPAGDRGVKGSPLWTKKPDLQLFYNASRDWARMHCPDVLLGAYSVDEISEIIDVTPRDETPIDHFGGEAPKQVSGA